MQAPVAWEGGKRVEGYKREKGEESEWTAAAERCLKRDSTGNSHPFDDGALPRARDDQATHTHTQAQTDS